MNSVRFQVEARAELVHEVGFYSAIRRRLGERFDKARGFKLEVQHPLRVKGERQYLLLPLTGKKGVATWDIAISPRKNDTSWGR